MVITMKYYTVESTYSVLSVHLTWLGAQAVLRQELLKDKTGACIFIKEHGIAEAFLGVAAVAVFAAIGVMLAWRG